MMLMVEMVSDLWGFAVPIFRIISFYIQNSKGIYHVSYYPFYEKNIIKPNVNTALL